jgi:GH25 family lysozyme M1 (1,4-beta-N-acetylmuramidase)
MGWVERRWKHVVVMVTFVAVVVPTVSVATPALAGPKVPGIDVSKYQGRIDWGAVATSPIRFAIMRATLGNDYRDGRFARNVAAARRTGLRVGAYHFAKPSLGPGDPRAEADHFLDVVGLRAGDVVPVLDIEETGGLRPVQLRNWASAWLRRVHERTGVRAMIYSGNYFWHGFMRNTGWFADRGHPLWVAHWYVGAPQVPGGRWGGRGYAVWQWSASGRIPGIEGPVDQDWMRGSLDQGTVASIVVRPAEGGVIGADRIACGGRLGFCSRLANPGDVVTLRATPADGARFVRWTGACASAAEAPICTLTALGTKEVSAVFGHPIASVVPSPQTTPVAPVGPSSDPRCDPDDPDCAIAALLEDQLERSVAPSPQPAPAPSPSPAPSPAPSSISISSPPRRSPVPMAVTEPPPPSAPEGDGDGTRYSWSREPARDAIGGSYRWERRDAASISFGFRGGAVTLFTVEGRAMGKARVSIDDEPVRIIDGYARRFRAGVRYRFRGLGAGAHRLTVTPLGRKDRDATDRRVSVDALRWGGKLHADPKPEDVSWARVDDPSTSDGGYVVSDAPGAQAELAFSGTSLTLLTLRGPAGGRAEILVDGRHVRTLDLYAPDRRRVAVRIVAGLAQGPHTATVVVLETRHGKSRGTHVAIDRWVVAYRPERSRSTEGHGRPHA